MSLNPAVSHKYNLGPVKPWVESAAYLVGNKFGVKTIYGWRATDPFPDHPSGHALDYMITSKAQGQQIADYLVANAGALGVKYVIWNRQVWEASGKPVAGWHAYTSTSNPHTDHVHVTFNDQPGSGQLVQAMVDATVAAVDAKICAWTISFPVLGTTCVISKTQLRTLIGLGVANIGVGIAAVGVILLVVYGLKQSDTGKAVIGAVPGGKVISKFT